MSIQITDPRLVRRLQYLARREQREPQEIIADAVAFYEAQPEPKSFLLAIADLALQTRAILPSAMMRKSWRQKSSHCRGGDLTPMPVLLDTSFLFALSDTSDRHHPQVLAVAQTIAECRCLFGFHGCGVGGYCRTAQCETYPHVRPPRFYPRQASSLLPF